MKELVLATNNIHKVREIQELVKDKYKLLNLKDIGFNSDIPEDKQTIEENALEKVRYIHTRLKRNCMADDTALEVEALNRQPGVFSARFAEITGEVHPGENISDANIRKLLNLMKGVKNRKACFRTIIALIIETKEYLFEGIVEGEILNEKRGSSGFGYDPVFRPSGYKQTFAEMSTDQKNRISHRAKAVQKLVEFLKIQK